MCKFNEIVYINGKFDQCIEKIPENLKHLGIPDRIGLIEDGKIYYYEKLIDNQMFFTGVIQDVSNEDL